MTKPPLAIVSVMPVTSTARGVAIGARPSNAADVVVASVDVFHSVTLLSVVAPVENPPPLDVQLSVVEFVACAEASLDGVLIVFHVVIATRP